MPSSFGTGLTEGFLKGWSEQSEKQDSLKRQEKQQQIQNNLSIINAHDLPDDVKQSAAQQLQDLMQGKKPGAKSSGGLSPVMGNLLKLIGKSHGQGGLTENTPNGQAAPGTAGSTPGAGFPQGSQPAGEQPGGPQPGQQPPPLAGPSNPGDRPHLAGSGSAETEPGAPPPAKPSMLDSQIARIQAQIGQTTNPFTRKKLQDRLGELEDMQIKGELETEKEARLETGKESLAKLKSENDKAIAELKGKQAEEIAKAKAEGAKEERAAKEKAQKELEDLREQNREKLKKTAPARNAGTGGGVDARARQRRVDRINDEHARASRAATDKYNAAKAKADQLSGTAKGIALRDAREALDRDTQLAEQAYKEAVRGLNNGGGGGQEDRVPVVSPDGKKGTVPRSQLPDALKQGYKEAA